MKTQKISVKGELKVVYEKILEKYRLKAIKDASQPKKAPKQ